MAIIAEKARFFNGFWFFNHFRVLLFLRLFLYIFLKKDLFLILSHRYRSLIRNIWICLHYIWFRGLGDIKHIYWFFNFYRNDIFIWGYLLFFNLYFGNVFLFHINRFGFRRSWYIHWINCLSRF